MGFTEANGTLGEVFDVISKSDMVVLLISDAAQVRGCGCLCSIIFAFSLRAACVLLVVLLLISDAAQVRLLPSIFHTNAACRCWCCCCSSPPPPRCGAAAAWVLPPVAAACRPLRSVLLVAAAAAAAAPRVVCSQRMVQTLRWPAPTHPRHTTPARSSSPPPTNPQAKLYPRILAAMKPGSTLGLSHGFLLGVMQVGRATRWGAGAPAAGQAVGASQRRA